MPAASSHSRERWAHPNWHRSSGGWSQASERHRVPLERKAGRCLLRAGASAVVKSGLTEMERRLEEPCSFFFLSMTVVLPLHYYLCVCTRRSLLSPLPPGCLCAAGISVPPLPPVGRRFYRRAATRPGCLSPGRRCSAGVSDCRSKCGRMGSPVTQRKMGEWEAGPKRKSVFVLHEQHNQWQSRAQFPFKECALLFFFFFCTGCFRQLGLSVSEHNLFRKRTVHKLQPLSDCPFVYSDCNLHSAAKRIQHAEF